MRYVLICVMGMLFLPALPGCQSPQTEQAEEAQVPQTTQPYINNVSGRGVENRTSDTGSVLH